MKDSHCSGGAHCKNYAAEIKTQEIAAARELAARNDAPDDGATDEAASDDGVANKAASDDGAADEAASDGKCYGYDSSLDTDVVFPMTSMAESMRIAIEYDRQRIRGSPKTA
jgi:hypothetical protein